MVSESCIKQIKIVWSFEFANLKRLNLEIVENLEGNRVVENSKKIRMVSTDFHGISIDTPEDLLKAEKFISLND